jgi:MFS family permease
VTETAPVEERPQLRGPRAALAVATHRNFGPYFVGNALSASGGWFHNLAAALLVYRETQSPFLLGVLNFAQFVPILVLSPWAGGVADRFDRRRVLYVTQVGAIAVSVTLGVLTVTGRADAWLVIGFSLLLGISSAFATPAQQALVTSLVPARDLGSAIALNSMTFNLARALGPALAAAVVAGFGLGVAFLVNAGSYLCFTVGLLLVEPRPQRRTTGRAPLRESIALLRENPRLLWLLFVVAAVGFASDPVNTESPAFAHAFGHSDTLAGILIGVFGAGAVTAALVFAGHAGSRGLTVATLAVLGGGIVAFSLSPSLWLALPFLFVAGFGYLAANARATTQLQLEVEEWQRGRIMALWSIAFLGLRPVASILDGAIANLAGVRAAGVALAVPALVAAALIYRRIRSQA